MLQRVRTHVLGYDPLDDPQLPSKRQREKEYHTGSRLLIQAKACSVLPPKTLVVMGDSMDMLLQGDLNSILSSFRAAAVDWLPHLPKIDNSHNRIPSNNSNRNQLPRMQHAAEFGIWSAEFAAVDWAPHSPKTDNSHNRIPSNNSNRNQIPRMLHAAELGIWPEEFKLKYEYLNGVGAMGAASDALRSSSVVPNSNERAPRLGNA